MSNVKYDDSMASMVDLSLAPAADGTGGNQICFAEDEA